MFPSKLSFTQAIFLPRYKLQWVQTAKWTALGGKKKRGNHDKLYFFQVIIILRCLCHTVPQTQQSAKPPDSPLPRTFFFFLFLLLFVFFFPFLPLYYLYFLDKMYTFAYLSHFKGWDDELPCLVLSITVSLVVMSLIIFKDNAFNNRFNPNLSIIMIEDDILSYICEWMVHFSSLHVVFQILRSCNVTLVCNFTKEWMWLFTKLIEALFKSKKKKGN